MSYLRALLMDRGDPRKERNKEREERTTKREQAERSKHRQGGMQGGRGRGGERERDIYIYIHTYMYTYIHAYTYTYIYMRKAHQINTQKSLKTARKKKQVDKATDRIKEDTYRETERVAERDIGSNNRLLGLVGWLVRALGLVDTSFMTNKTRLSPLLSRSDILNCSLELELF